MYASVCRMWKKHMIDEAGVDKAVKLNWITAAQGEQIKKMPR
jgi:hypothetical protein